MKKVNYSSLRNVMIRVSAVNKINMDNDELGVKAGDIVTYDLQDIVKNLIQWSKRKNFYFYLIKHDEDKDNVHFHMVLTFTSPTSFKTIKRRFPYGDIRLCEYGVKNCIQYLVHMNNPEKHQYSWDDVITNAPPAKLEGYKTPRGQSDKERLNATVQMIISGKIQEYDIDKIEQDIYVKYLSKINNAFDYYKKLQMKNSSADKKCIVLQGVAGAGKTTLCKIIAQMENKTIAFSSCSNDVMANYRLGLGYYVIDDFNYRAFDIEDFKKLTDNNTNTTIKRRYKNVYFDSDVMIATNLNFLDWYSEASEIDRQAIHRRITCIMDFLPLQEDKVARYYIKSVEDLYRDRAKMEELNGNVELYQQYIDDTYKVREVDLKKYISFENNEAKKEEFLGVLNQL